jgi:hypothetical protein
LAQPSGARSGIGILCEGSGSGADALFDEVPSFLQAKLALASLLVAFGPLGRLLLQLLTPFLVSHFLDLGPLFRGHCPLHTALVGGFFFSLYLSLALPIRHAFPDEFSPIPPGDVMMRSLPQALLLVLFAHDPPVRPGQGGLGESRITGEREQRKR